MPLHNHLACRRLSIVILAAMLFSCATAAAQWVDHRGKVFRIAFLPTNGADEFPSFILDISCDRPASGTITYTSSGRSQNLQITVPNKAVQLRLDSLELMLPNPRNIEISQATLLLEFNNEVTVHGLNTQRWSSDGFLALPYDALGTRYMILSYPNTIAPEVRDTATVKRSDFPSQFAIVAMENNTVVQIDPTAPINNHPDTPFSIKMNAGDLFVGQAAGVAGIDLTGTEITANKKITVYGGHQRANVPWKESIGRDHLVEQLPPIEYWGRWAILTPHFELEKSIPDSTIARILAVEDGTTLTVDKMNYTLNAGEFRELAVEHPKFVSASQPVLVAQYHHSAVDEKFIAKPTDSIGDPSMTLVPSPEQYLDNYSFYSYGTKDFTLHYINIVIPTSAMFTMVLDGSPLIPPEFQIVEEAPYVCARVQVTPGPHTISAARPFGLLVYGYGPYNSYGYPAGMAFEPIPLGVEEDAGGEDLLSVDLRMMQGRMEVRAAAGGDEHGSKNDNGESAAGKVIVQGHRNAPQSVQ